MQGEGTPDTRAEQEGSHLGGRGRRHTRVVHAKSNGKNPRWVDAQFDETGGEKW
jgi:hypothetical protein